MKNHIKVYNACDREAVEQLLRGPRIVGCYWSTSKEKLEAEAREQNLAYVLEALVNPIEVDDGGAAEGSLLLADGAEVFLESLSVLGSENQITINQKALAQDDEEEEADADIGSGPGGPNGYTRISDEVDFAEDGQPLPQLLKPYPQSPKNMDSYPRTTPEAPDFYNDNIPYSNSPPNLRVPFRRDEERVNKNPNAPNFIEKMDKLSRRVESDNKQMFFPQFLQKVKSTFPNITNPISTPPTYIVPKDKDGKLDSKKIKDLLKVRLPELVWAPRFDGAEAANIVFPDDTSADLTIGASGDDTLTLIYNVKGN